MFDPHRVGLVGDPFVSGGSQLQSSAASPDGRHLAAMSSDGLVRVWDMASRVPIGPPLQGQFVGDVPYQPACRAE